MASLPALAQMPYGGGFGGYGMGGYGMGGYGGMGSNSPYMPNMYNSSSQPLSPYLNMLRGGNPAVNYFYGVRPGMMGGPMGAMPFLGSMGSQGRQTFFPSLDTLTELEDEKPTASIRPTGHPFGFNNTMGYFGAGSGTFYGYGMRFPNMNQNKQSPLTTRVGKLGH